MSANMLLEKLLREKISKMGISEREAARQTGTSPTTIGRVLRGEGIDVDTLIAICAWLEVSPSNILDAQIPGEPGFLPSLAAVIERNPALGQVFKQAMDQFLAGEISADAVEDLVQFAAYRLGLEKINNERRTAGTMQDGGSNH